MAQTREPLILLQRKDHLPGDVILNILARLPVKSLFRFRCVCKSWDSLITSPYFISTHLNNNNNDHDCGYLLHMPNAVRYIMHSSSSANSPVCTVVCDCTFNRISKYPIPFSFHLCLVQIIGLCNGLLCSAEHGNGPSFADVLYLWNPSI